jgi:hypothetical protein
MREQPTKRHSLMNSFSVFSFLQATDKRFSLMLPLFFCFLLSCSLSLLLPISPPSDQPTVRQSLYKPLGGSLEELLPVPTRPVGDKGLSYCASHSSERYKASTFLNETVALQVTGRVALRFASRRDSESYLLGETIAPQVTGRVVGVVAPHVELPRDKASPSQPCTNSKRERGESPLPGLMLVHTDSDYRCLYIIACYLCNCLQQRHQTVSYFFIICYYGT